MTASKLALVIGLTLLLGGFIAAGLVYRNMKTEALIHARTAIVQVCAADSFRWKSDNFALYQEGTHLLLATSSLAPGTGEASNSNIPTPLGANLEVRIEDPSGRQSLARSYTGGTLTGFETEARRWIRLDSIRVEEPYEGVWKLHTRALYSPRGTRADTMEVFIFPPQRYEIGQYLSRQMFILIGMGLMIVVGFGLLIFSGILSRR